MIPMSKLETALSGSVSDQVRMGLFDNMDSETLPGSRLESFVDLLHRHVSQSSSGYNADVSGSYKSDSGSLRMSRFSIASTFDPAPIACSSMLSRASLEPPTMPSSSEFAMPRNPVRQKTTRSANGDVAKPSSPNEQSKEVVTGPLPSHSSLYPDSTESPSTVDPAAQSDQVISKSKDQELAVPAAFTAIKATVRKRGRKPKIPEVIKEAESSTDTPPKKRRGRPPLDGTPAKNKSSANGNKQEPQKKDSNADQPPGGSGADPGQSNEEPASDKSSEDYLREVEEVWREGRHRSYENGSICFIASIQVSKYLTFFFFFSILDKPVFAQWTGKCCLIASRDRLFLTFEFLKHLDKCYYAARIVKRDSVQTGKWTVIFDDGQSRSLVEEFILPVSLLNKNQPILVLNENLSEGRPGVVIGYSKTKSLDQVRKIFNV